MRHRCAQHKHLLATVDRLRASEEIFVLADLYEIRVRRPGDLPRAEDVRIRLSRFDIAKIGEYIGLRLYDEHRSCGVGADRMRWARVGGGDVDRLAPLAEGELSEWA